MRKGRESCAEIRGPASAERGLTADPTNPSSTLFPGCQPLRSPGGRMTGPASSRVAPTRRPRGYPAASRRRSWASVALVFFLAAFAVLTFNTTAWAQDRDTTNPVLQSATVSGNTVTMTYNEPLLEDSCPPDGQNSFGTPCPDDGIIEQPQGAQFRWSTTRSPLPRQQGSPNRDSVMVSGSTVTLVFEGIDTASSVYLEYERGIFPIRDVAGNWAAALDWIELPFRVPDQPTDLTAAARAGAVQLTWDAPPAGIAGHQYRYKTNGAYGGWVEISQSAFGGDNQASFTVPGLTNGTAYTFQVQAFATLGTNRVFSDPSDEASATPMAGVGTPPITSTPPGRTGGGGGGGSSVRDQHGNIPTQATEVPLGDAPWTSSTDGQINPASDIDYFQLTIPQAGVLLVETSGSTDTVGTVSQDDEELVMADSGGERRNFRLSVPVQAGPVLIAVEGTGTGTYTLETTLLVGYLENPGRDSFQSGIGVLSGWTCDADLVEIEINGNSQPAAYGTERLDTEPVCGDTDNGFGLLFNWNRLGAGEHTIVALVDGVELGQATVTVTTLDEEEEFVRDLTGQCTVENFPMAGETVLLTWQQTSQNFVITGEAAPDGANMAGSAEVGYLENPGPNSFQSGIGVISGWVCEADRVEIVIDDAAPQVAGYGTERLDTEPGCGDTNNGFGLLYNWNRLDDGVHTVVALVDSVELGRATVQVTTLGEEFVRGAAGECVAEDFPMAGETVTLKWIQNSQNFVITDRE